MWEGVPPCALYFGYEFLLYASQDFISPPQCPGASTWRGGVTMNDAHVRAKWTIQFKEPFPKNLNMNYEWVFH